MCITFIFERKPSIMDNTELAALREQILAKAKEYFSESICNQWLSPLTVRALDEHTLTLGR